MGRTLRRAPGPNQYFPDAISAAGKYRCRISTQFAPSRAMAADPRWHKPMRWPDATPPATGHGTAKYGNAPDSNSRVIPPQSAE